jgi:hypothetical protein
MAIKKYSHNKGMTNGEAANLRRQLKLRYNNGYQCWEVFTIIHGTDQHRWFRITDSKKDWYIKNFPEITIDLGERK